MSLEKFIDLPEPKKEEYDYIQSITDWFCLNYFEQDEDGWYGEGLELRWKHLEKVSCNIRYPQFNCRQRMKPRCPL